MHLYLAGEDNPLRLESILYDLDSKCWYSVTSVAQVFLRSTTDTIFTTSLLPREINSALTYLIKINLIDRYATPRRGRKAFYRLNANGLMFLKTKYNILGLIDPSILIRMVSEQIQKEESNENKDLPMDGQEQKSST